MPTLASRRLSPLNNVALEQGLQGNETCKTTNNMVPGFRKPHIYNVAQTFPELAPKEALEEEKQIKQPGLSLRLRSLLFSVVLARMCG